MKKIILYNQGQIFLAVLGVTVALGVNTLIILIPPPISFTGIISNFHLGVALLLITFFGAVFSGRGILWDAVSLTITLVLFSLPLIYKWQTAGYYGYLLGGLLPWSDAQGYYSGAYQLIYHGQLSAWATRRPLFGAFLAVLLSLTSQHLQITLAIMAVLNGLANFLALNEIRKTHGPFSAALFMAICYWFYCFHTGNTASEQLGLCLGNLGLALLIRGAVNVSIRKSAYGLFLLTLALNARAGAFFILPVIALWFGLHFNGGKRHFTPIVVGLCSIAVGMLANLTLVKLIGPQDVTPFSNYSYTLYGLASDNKGWSQVIRDYPDVKEEEVLGLAIQKIKETPSLFVKGVFHAYREYFTTFRGQFSFLNKVSDRNPLGGQILWALTWVALASAAYTYKRKGGQSGLILAAFLGIILSVGLVPPIDSDSMRVYAATIPFTAYIASSSFALIEQPLKRGKTPGNIPETIFTNSNALVFFSLAMLALVLVGPLVIKSLSSYKRFNTSYVKCPQGTEEIIFFMNTGSDIELVNDQSIDESYMPRIRIADLKKGVKLGPTLYPYLSNALLELSPYQILSVGVYQKLGVTNADILQTGYLITQDKLLKPGTHNICVAPAQDEQLKSLFFYYAPSAEESIQTRPTLFHQSPNLVNLARRLYKFAFASIIGIALFRVPLTRIYKYWLPKKQ